ncbi:type IV pilus twitching motility protein PilT [Clostridium hydrogenum]|uniref:type IV pilus twitching motility protein PilT n=1 Tax=Clostridium hydrogenum TaxID=2855764 RepID=UPI001F2CF19B|nr:type IV pilus twitching motility protein PilT [Clostridium hydrogenum]
MKLLNELLRATIEKKASDLHITVGIPPVLRINGKLTMLGDEKVSQDDAVKYTKEILGDEYEKYVNTGEVDKSHSVSGIGRFRVNIYKQRGSDTLAIRTVELKVPSLKDLEFPSVLNDLITKKRGLVLVTGPTGSGKSTTLAAMINEINSTRSEHIVTLEEPIEFIHKHNKSIINQREIGKDTLSYKAALKAVLREDPDVILIGEMRDFETISTAITAAETGHLVFSTLHTIGAAKTIDRIIDVFPLYQQQQIRIQLAGVLQGIISQQLIQKQDGKGRIAALEIMLATPAIQNLIREGKTHQIESIIQTGAKYGMKTMDSSIEELFKQGIISYDSAIASCVDREFMTKMLVL